VAGDPIFEFSDPYMPIQLYNLYGATMTIEGSLQVSIAIAIVKAF